MLCVRNKYFRSSNKIFQKVQMKYFVIKETCELMSS
jgi:hypothetical protein